MKNIFIGGAAKSGKSTLAKKIITDNLHYNYIPLDYFASSLKHNFPETEINSNVVIDKKSSEKLALLVSRVSHIISSVNDELFIIDSAHILPEDIIQYLDKDKWEIIYVGYPNISVQDKFNEIRKYEKKSDWTYDRTDDELFDILEKTIQLSKSIENFCLENGIHFIDTSSNSITEMDRLF